MKLNHALAQQLTTRHRASSSLLEAGRRPVRSQIPLRYLVADRLEAGRRPASSC